MPGRANELIVIPDSFWQRPETIAALRSRAIGQFFDLLRQYAGASQTQIGMACGMAQSKVSDIVRGVQQVETLAVFERIADGLNMPDPARIILGLAPRTTSGSTVPAQRPLRTIPSGDNRPALEAHPFSDLLSLDSGDRQEEDDPVRRRTFVGLTGASVFSAMFADSARGKPSVDAESLAPVLATHEADAPPAPLDVPPDITALKAAVNNARRQYQACRYSELVRNLPDLLAQLHAASVALDGEARPRAYALSADAHHVAAGLLLKLDDQGLAYLAADRSMRAAQASEDPITVGASARIITHALMNGGHLAAAVDTVTSHAARLNRDVSHTPESLSVYGSLLLRGAIAAALHSKRGIAHELLAEADDAGRQLGVDGNLRWTAFGPTNARLHRVNIAVTLGDAGTAIDTARSIDLSKITITERKASLLIDTARAFLQWGKHEKAYLALRAAEQTAPEEVAGRPSVHRLVHELVISAPPTVRRDAERFATQLGVSR
ncbi:MAG TPA: helix-turn-helix transcriptional regulator [Streptosporangiaceae bacterium]|jgi:transcriptional regulator with XRE-family HTH domain|nr:helix-turn-helix transcriptional regulator [Streptosporangiaceae bacterium]